MLFFVGGVSLSQKMIEASVLRCIHFVFSNSSPHGDLSLVNNLSPLRGFDFELHTR